MSGKGDIQRKRQNTKGQGPLLYQPDAGLVIPAAAGGAGQIAGKRLHGLGPALWHKGQVVQFCAAGAVLAAHTAVQAQCARPVGAVISRGGQL